MKFTKIMVMPLLIAALLVGCSQDSEQLKPPTGPSAMLAASLADLTASSIQSATLTVRIWEASGNEISVHTVMEPWDEMTVTFNSFGGAFDATSLGSFMADALAWRSTDITSLVVSWLDGSIPNNGVLLQYVDITSPVTPIYSRESNPVYMVQPRLEVCYETGAGIECSTLVATADTYIQELSPDDNFGSREDLYVGHHQDTPLKKQILIRFYIPTNPELASIGDYVWLDTNEDGFQDGGEVGYQGAEVQLFDCFGGLIATTTTDATGYYLFDNLDPGDYNIKFIKPEGYTFSPQDQGADDAMDSDADPTTGVAICTTLDPGEHDPTWDAGLFLPVWDGCSLTIGFWKTHGGFGPQADVVSQYLPILLGSFDVANGQIAHDVLVMKTYGKPSNGITKLMAQMLGVRLNEASGADVGAVASELAEADAFLSIYDWTAWNGFSKSEKKGVINLMSAFDDYNNGDIGPGHCD